MGFFSDQNEEFRSGIFSVFPSFNRNASVKNLSAIFDELFSYRKAFFLKDSHDRCAPI